MLGVESSSSESGESKEDEESGTVLGYRSHGNMVTATTPVPNGMETNVERADAGGVGPLVCNGGVKGSEPRR